MARGPGYQLFLTSEGVRMTIPGARQSPGTLPASGRLKYSTIQMKLTGSREWKDMTGLQPTGGVSNYLRGNDGKTSITGIPNYARVSVAGVYEGVDLVFYDHGGDLEYDFVVKPGADPTKIQLAFEGTERMRVDDKSGDLVLTMAGGFQLRQVRPKVYQKVDERSVEIAGGYQLLGDGRAAFTLAPYDRRRPLVIDPTVSFTKFLIGNEADFANAVAVDKAGNSYVAGESASVNFPIVPANSSSWQEAACPDGGLNSFCAGLFYDSFVTKLSPTGDILFSTFVGPGDLYAIALDSTGVVATGDIEPARGSPITYPGYVNAYIFKLSPTGSFVYYQIYGSGGGSEQGNAIAVDSQDNAWVTGYTHTVNGKAISSADIFVLKLAPTGQQLFYQTWGSSGDDSAMGIAVDPADQPWVTGKTCGDGFPTTDGIFHPANGCSVFVMQLERAGNTRMSAVFGGSAAGDAGTGIVANGSNAAYITGYTNSANFPVTVDGYQTVRTSTGSQAFVTEFDSSSLVGHIVHSTLLGADGNTVGLAIAADNAGGVYVAGNTSSANFPGTLPLTPNPTAGFVSKFSFNLGQLRYTKLLGAAVAGLAVLNPQPGTSIPQIYTTGYRYTGSVAISNLDAFVVKLDDDVVQSQALWQNPSTGELFAGLLDAQGNVTSTQKLSVQCGPSNGCSQNWKVIGTLDANRDGVGDILLYNATSGQLQAWLLNSSGAFIGTQSIRVLCGPSNGCSQNWKPVGVGDFNHDGIDDILWHNDATGELQAWLLDGAGGVPGTLTLSKKCAVTDGCWTRYNLIAIGDFDGDGIDDLFWLDTTTGAVEISLLNGSGVVPDTRVLAKQCGPADGCSTTWKCVGMGDVNRDGFGDLLWENPATGQISAWLLNGTDRILGTQSLSLGCNAASGCSQGSIPVGILRDHLLTN